MKDLEKRKQMQTKAPEILKIIENLDKKQKETEQIV